MSRPQALRHVTDDAIRWFLGSGRWQRIVPGVYATHRGPVSWEMRAHASVLYCGSGAALAKESAGWMHGFIRKPPQVITVAIPHGRKVRRVPGMRVIRHRVLVPAVVRGLAITAPAPTVLDCCANQLLGEKDVIALVAEAIRCEAVTEEVLADALRNCARHPHRRIITLAIGDVAEGAESALEVLAVRDVIRAHGLPEMTIQAPGDGGRLRRDLENEEFGVIFELDGRIGHEGAGRIADLRRDRKAASSGRVTLRAGWVDAAIDPCLDVHWRAAMRSGAGLRLASAR